MPEMKEIKVSEVLNYLKNGVTRWKKEDLGFGSLEEIYGLTFTEVKELIDHPKIKGVKTKIPTMRIIDDTDGEAGTEETTEETTPVETKVEVAAPVVKTLSPITSQIETKEEVVEEEPEPFM